MQARGGWDFRRTNNKAQREANFTVFMSAAYAYAYAYGDGDGDGDGGGCSRFSQDTTP